MLLLTGATGFLGGHLARLLAKRGAELRLLVRPTSDRRRLEGISAEVVEGVATTKSVVELAERSDVEMPIVRAVSAILYDGLSPREAIAMLMSRALKDEKIG